MKTYRLRASGLSDLLDCGLRWYARNVLDMRMPSSAAAHIGTAVHAGGAAFDRAVMDGRHISTSDAVDVAIASMREEPDEGVDWDMAKNEAESITVSVTAKYCSEIAPKQSFTHIEHTFEDMPIQATENVIIELTGTTDRIFKEANGYGVADIKTGKTRVNTQGVVKTQGDKAQLGIYTVLAEKATGLEMNLPSRILGLSTTKQPRAGVAEVRGAKAALVGVDGAPGMLELVGKLLDAELFLANPRSQLCGEKYCVYWNKCTYR